MSSCGLLLDFGGTLDAAGKPWSDRFLALYHEAGGTRPEPEFRAAFSHSDWMLAQVPGIATCNYSATVEIQVRLLAGQLADGACLMRGSTSEAFVTGARRFAAAHRGMLEELAARYRLGVVSNFQGNLQPCLDELGIGDVFDVVADSTVVGCRKPGRAIFDGALAALGCDATESWMVGDSPPNDIAAAAELGMKTCWVAPAHRIAEGISPTARVTSISELPAVLAA